jgi:hypothetical protein
MMDEESINNDLKPRGVQDGTPELLQIDCRRRCGECHARLWPNGEAYQLELPTGFNRLTRSYADFCALPPDKRVFYKVNGDRIVETKLDEATWKPTIWTYNPAPSSIAGAMWSIFAPARTELSFTPTDRENDAYTGRRETI